MMKIKKLYIIIPGLILAAFIFISQGCFWSGNNIDTTDSGNGETKVETEEETVETESEVTEEIESNEKEGNGGMQKKEKYVEDMGGLINKLRSTVKESEKVIEEFENEDLQLTEINSYVSDYINSVEKTNEQFLNIEPPGDAGQVHNSFGKAMEKFLASTRSLDKFMETSIFNVDEKISYMEQAYKEAQEGEMLLKRTEGKLDEYENSLKTENKSSE